MGFAARSLFGLAFALGVGGILGCGGNESGGPREAGAVSAIEDAPSTSDVAALADVATETTDAGPAADAGCLTIAPPYGPPWPLVTDGATKAGGSCAGKTLQDVIDAVLAAHPELADITRIYAPGTFPDGSFVYAFATPDGFMLAFVRGGGDCPAGCTEHEYWYFQTDSSCAPELVGHFDPSSANGCPDDAGTPMWTVPASSCGRMPTCGADGAP